MKENKSLSGKLERKHGKINIKRTVYLIMVLVLAFSLCGCSSAIKAEVGKTVTLGTYEQDGDTSNEKEDIEWIVLAKEDGKALVISKYILDIVSYNENLMDTTWETCSLRKWLNETFLNEAFSENEQNVILETEVKECEYSNTDNTIYGNSTSDKLFLLGEAEFKKYLSDDEHCAFTMYAKQKISVQDDFDSTWWLRTPGYLQDNAEYVDYFSNLNKIGAYVNYNKHGVRPVMWIKAE